MSGLMQLGVGSVFAGDYRIVRPLGEGGMGAVYVAEQLSTGKQRALKVMRSSLLTNDRLRQRFAQEARLGALIDSDHVVEVVAAGVEQPSGMPWLAMELLTGETLAERASRGEPIPVAEVAEILAQLCHAMAAAHAAGIVHRDLKPENVFLAKPRRQGAPFVVKVLDFGIAKLVAEAQTSATAAIGTPLWMAPEQTEPGVAISPAADVWAVGLIVFFLLTGRCYWRGASRENGSAMSLLREVVFDPLDSASVRAAWLGVARLLPAKFDDWFARCVAREASARFADAGAAHDALVPVLDAAALGSAATVLLDSPRITRRASTPSPAAPTPLPATHEADAIAARGSTTGAVARSPVERAKDARPPLRLAAIATATGMLALAGILALASLGRRPPARAVESNTPIEGQPAPSVRAGENADAPTAVADARASAIAEATTIRSAVASSKPTAPSPVPTPLPEPTASDRPPLVTAATSATNPPLATPPSGTGEFDKRAARASLSAIPYKDCGGIGQGKLDVTFAPNGTVTAVVVVSGDYVAATRSCIADRFRKATIPAFTGDAHTVGWRIYAF